MDIIPFELKIKLLTPIQLGRYLRLDGLLWHALYLHYGCPTKAQERLHDYLSLDKSGRYFCASTMIFGFIGANRYFNQEPVYENLVALKRAKIGVMRGGNELSPDNFGPNAKRGSGYKKIQLQGGVYKTRLKHHQTYYSHSVLFHGKGKGEKISDLLNFYIVSLGVNANNGSGTIGDITHSVIKDDYSLIDANGLPARPIPVDDYMSLSGNPSLTGDAILIPPFRNQEATLCALPERIRKIKISTTTGDQ